MINFSDEMNSFEGRSKNGNFRLNEPVAGVMVGLSVALVEVSIYFRLEFDRMIITLFDYLPKEILNLAV